MTRIWYLMKNPQTTNALTFLTHNISDLGGVRSMQYAICNTQFPDFSI
jgi:hypothetical protein